MTKKVAKKDPQAEAEDVIYCIKKWERSDQSEIREGEEVVPVIYFQHLKEMNDGNWEYLMKYQFLSKVDGSIEKEEVQTEETLRYDSEDLQEYKDKPWDHYYVYSGPGVMIRAFELQGGTWSSIPVFEDEEYELHKDKE